MAIVDKLNEQVSDDEDDYNNEIFSSEANAATTQGNPINFRMTSRTQIMLTISQSDTINNQIFDKVFQNDLIC